MKITVVGLGKLGSPLAAVLASKGFKVSGFDSNEHVVMKINKGQAPIKENGLQELLDTYGRNLQAFTEIAPALEDSDISFVIVPTPSLKTGRFDNSNLLEVVKKIGNYLANKEKYHVINIVSTVMPGSVDGEIRESLEKASGRKVGVDLGLTYNPEFIALGSVIEDMLYPDMILLGESDSKAGELLERVYTTVVGENVPKARLSIVDAEITKISVNTFVTTKISFASMLASVCEKTLGANASKVAAAVGMDSRIGRKYFRPGAPFGGPCFPRDAIAFSVFAKDSGGLAQLADATSSINLSRVEEIVDIVTNAISPTANLGVVGLSYKPGTHITEESFGVRLVERLLIDSRAVFSWDRIMSLSDYPKSIASTHAGLKEILEKCDVLILALNDEKAVKEIIDHSSYQTRAGKIRIYDLWSCWPIEDQNLVWSIGTKLTK